MSGLGDAHQAFFATWSTCDDGSGFSFKHLDRKSGMDRTQFEPLVRDLADAGHLRFMRGCLTDEGTTYGSAYVLTVAGYHALHPKEPKHDA